MKKRLALFLALVLMFSVVAVGCGTTEETSEEVKQEENTKEEEKEEEKGTEEKAGEYEDGIYFAQEDGFSGSGWKYVLTLEVKDGKIVKADWNGVNSEAGPTKKELSKEGKYGMADKGAQWPWYEQAEKAEAYLIEKQDPTDIDYTSDDGKTDAISGATIKVKSFFDLAEKALNQGPVGRGEYKDGVYYAEQAEFSHGWKYFAKITVVNGYIVAADWDGIGEETEKTKDQASADGDYGMKEKGNAQALWVEQADKAEAYLVETQDATEIEYTTDDGKTDAISGATIKVKAFFDLAQKALADAK